MGTSLLYATLLAATLTIANSHNHEGAPSFCGLEPETGVCNGYEPRWYYNVKAGTCLRFMYRGCGGNLNNFANIDDCMRVCKGITRASPMGPPEKIMPEGPQMMMNPYKALLSAMTPRIKPFLAIFANMRKEQQTTASPPTQQIAGRSSPGPVQPGMIRVLINRGRPAPGYMHPRPTFRVPTGPSNVNMYKKRVHTNNFAPEFRKDVIMAPESYDNRFQSHAMPSNKVTLVQVFVNKNRRNRGNGKSWRPGMPEMYQHQHSGFPMHSHPFRPPMPMPRRPSFPPKPWWTRFARPIVTFPSGRGGREQSEEVVDQSWYPTDNSKDNEEDMRFFQTTTYPPDYPKWDTEQVARPDWESRQDAHIKDLKAAAEERVAARRAQKEAQMKAKMEAEETVVVEEEQNQEDNEPSYSCMLPVEAGPCKALEEKWYFNKDSGKCEKFYYGGCRGNANRFSSEQECQRTCKVSSAEQQDTTPYPDDVIVVTENVYAPAGEYENQDVKASAPVNEKEIAVTSDPREVKDVVKDVVKETAVEKPVQETQEEKTDIIIEESDAPSVGRLVMTSEMEYIIIIVAVCLVGVIVIILVSFTIAHVFGKLKRSKKEKIVEAVVASNPIYSSDYPKLVYYGHTIVPPAPQPDIPDIHTLNKIDPREDV